MGNDSVINVLISGSISSTFTTVLYQPLELLKTRLQLQNAYDSHVSRSHIFGRTTKSAIKLVNENGLLYLWRGTGPSLARAIPGVSLYYASLNILQSNFSQSQHKPDSSAQAFQFALASRSLVSFILLPITVVKVHYESGQIRYSNLFDALVKAYGKKGWIAVTPTILRDALFSGVYYMLYTRLRSHEQNVYNLDVDQKIPSQKTFLIGAISGLAASILTNPIDVIKTRMQVKILGEPYSVRETLVDLLKERNGLLRLYDGLVPRSIRRTLIAASTWTFFEYLMDKSNRNDVKSL